MLLLETAKVKKHPNNCSFW